MPFILIELNMTLMASAKGFWKFPFFVDFRIVVLTACFALLSACGGGGSGDGVDTKVPVTTTIPTPSTPTPIIPIQKFSLSGQITIPASAMVDSDVSDGTSATSNNSFATAQTLSSPSLLGGYVSLASGTFSAISGNGTAYVKDTDDFFKVTLEKNQSINLNYLDDVSESSVGGLNLYLYDNNKVLLKRNTSNAVQRTLTTPSSNVFYIRVQAKSKAVLYQLNVGVTVSALSAASHSEVSELDDFVSDEVIIQFNENAGSSGQRAVQSGSSLGLRRAQSDGLSVKAQAGKQWLMKLSDFNAATSRSQQSVSETPKQRTAKMVNWLRKQSYVATAYPNYIRHGFAVANDAIYQGQWDLPLMNVDKAWDIVKGRTMNRVNVAVIDSGVRLAQEDLQGQLAEGYDFIDNDTTPQDNGSASFGADSFHGTHVTGTIVALTNNSRGIAGIAGMADKSDKQWAKVMPLRVLDGDGLGTDFNIAAAIRYAAGLAVTNSAGQTVNPSLKMDVINLSLGGGGECGILQAAINEARANNVIVVAAAGNENSSTKSFPAACNGVVAVGAVGADKSRAPYSNFAASSSDIWIDVTAPGGNGGQDLNADGYPDAIWSTWAENDQYTLLQGTSMSSPHAAAVFALMRGVDSSLTPANIDALIAEGSLTQDIGASGRDKLFGYGFIDAERALKKAANVVTILPAIALSSSNLNFGVSQTTADLNVLNSGTGILKISGVVSSASWLTSVKIAVDSNGLGDYSVNISRVGLDPGIYSGTLTVSANGVANAKITVLMQVGVSDSGSGSAANVGRHFVLLLDQSFNTRYQAEVDTNTSVYTFNLTNVDAGVYYLAAGTDLDGDGFICDKGEYCAEYPVSSALKTIDLTTSSKTSANMSTGYVFSQSATALKSVGHARQSTGVHRGYQRLFSVVK